MDQFILRKLLAVFMFVSSLIHAEEAAPSAEQIISRAKMSAVLQQADLAGNLIKDRTKTPVTLFLRSNNIQMQVFEKNQWNGFHMRMEDAECDLFRVIDQKTVKFPTDQIAQPIANTDLTYEDLAMRFLYWPKPSLEGSERVGAYDCWKIRVNNPGQSGAYKVVYVWVHRKFGAFMKIEGFNRQGQKIKSFEVDSVQKIKVDTYTLKQMTVNTINPTSNRIASQTKVVFDESKVLQK
jgi:Outer membrane lipoprotein-sorting protein